MGRKITWALALLLSAVACTPLRGGRHDQAVMGGDGPADGGRAKDAAADGASSSTPAVDAAPAVGPADSSVPSPEGGEANDAMDGSMPAPDAGNSGGMSAPMCLDVGERCTDGSQCCGTLSCDITTVGRACCGEQGASCAFSGGQDCCRDLLCIDGYCGKPVCLHATRPCADASQCCNGLSCDTTTLGRVCCGESGASCSRAGGEDCCRDLLCINGRCAL